MKNKLKHLFSTALLGAAASALSAPATISIPQSGESMKDGTKFVSIAPRNKLLFTTPTDAPQNVSSRQAEKYCRTLTFGGHNDWRVPSAAENFALSLHRDTIGGFNKTEELPKGYYQSSTTFTDGSRKGLGIAVNGNDGYQMTYKRDIDLRMSLRCVRLENLF